MNNPKTRIFAQYGNHGLDIYLDISGNQRRLATRNSNGLLYVWLKDGKTISELSRVKPRYNRSAQKIYHYAQYLVKLTKAYFKYAV